MNTVVRTAISGVASLTLAALVLTGCAASDNPEPNTDGDAAPSGQGFDAIVEAAGEEGSLLVYSAASESINEAIAAEFNAQYPDIDVSITRLSSSDLRGRFASETSVGATSADVVIITDPLMFLNDPDWFTPLTAEEVPSVANLLDGYAHDNYVSVVTSPWVITYNTEKIETAPTEWSDLAEPEFLSNATLNDPRLASDSVLSFWQLLMDEYGEGFLGELSQTPSWFESSVPAVQEVAAGQYSLAAPGAKAHSLALRAEGAPVEPVVPEPVVAFSNLMGIASDAQSPNAARVFADFMLSAEGQAAFCGDNLYMTLIDTAVAGCDTTPDDALIADPVRAAAERESILAAFGLD